MSEYLTVTRAGARYRVILRDDSACYAKPGRTAAEERRRAARRATPWGTTIRLQAKPFAGANGGQVCASVCLAERPAQFADRDAALAAALAVIGAGAELLCDRCDAAPAETPASYCAACRAELRAGAEQVVALYA